MKSLARKSVVVASVLLSIATCQAGEYAEALGNCVTASTTGKDRIDLARWMFTGMSMHPKMADLAQIDINSRAQVSQTAQTLYKRLITEQCAKEYKNARLQEGTAGIQAGFEALGRFAMQELMLNPGVQAEFAKVNFGQ